MRHQTKASHPATGFMADLRARRVPKARARAQGAAGNRIASKRHELRDVARQHG